MNGKIHVMIISMERLLLMGKNTGLSMGLHLTVWTRLTEDLHLKIWI